MSRIVESLYEKYALKENSDLLEKSLGTEYRVVTISLDVAIPDDDENAIKGIINFADKYPNTNILGWDTNDVTDIYVNDYGFDINKGDIN